MPAGEERTLTYTPAVRRVRTLLQPSRRRVCVLLSAVAATIAIASPAAAFLPVLLAADQTATLGTDAWWNRATGPQEGLPPEIALPLPAPSIVPAGAISTGAVAGQPDKVAAVGLLLDAPAGTTVRRLDLTLRESGEPGANIRSADVALLACPITSAWTPVRNGNWVDRPSWDCGTATAAGVRSDDGTWTFDLASVARLWLDPSAPLEPLGVALVVDTAASPETAQVAFVDRASGGIAVAFSADAPESAPSAGAPRAVRPPAGSAPAAPSAAFPDAAAPAPSPETPDTAVLVAAPALAQGAAPEDPNVLGNLPIAAVVLVPVALGAAALLSYLLGPAGDPEPGQLQRKGSITRALEKERSENR